MPRIRANDDLEDGIAPARGSQEAQRARHQKIAESVIKRGSMSIGDIVRATGVSAMTIYRDVATLEEAGIVSRQRGQVLAVAGSLQEASAGFRLEQNHEIKASMAAALASRIKPGSSLVLDDSTSGVWLLRALENVAPLTVVTNSLLVAQEVGGRDDIRLLMTGGEYQPWAQALMGEAAISGLSRIHADVCVMSASGVVDGRCMHPYGDVAAVKRAMLASAHCKVLMLDHTKFTRRALHAFAAVEEFDIVVVDRATAQRTLDWLAELDVETIISEE